MLDILVVSDLMWALFAVLTFFLVAADHAFQKTVRGFFYTAIGGCFFLSIYEQILKKDGILEFKTDNKDLFDFSLIEIKNSHFNLVDYTYDLHNDNKLNNGNIMTEYEEKFSEKGNPICKFIAKLI